MMEVADNASQDSREEYDPVRLAHRCVEAMRIEEMLLPHERLYVGERASDLIDCLRKISAVSHRHLTSHNMDQRITYDAATLRINLGRELLRKRSETTMVA